MICKQSRAYEWEQILRGLCPLSSPCDGWSSIRTLRGPIRSIVGATLVVALQCGVLRSSPCDGWSSIHSLRRRECIELHPSQGEDRKTPHCRATTRVAPTMLRIGPRRVRIELHPSQGEDKGQSPRKICSHS